MGNDIPKGGSRWIVDEQIPCSNWRGWQDKLQEKMNLDQLVYDRSCARAERDWAGSDKMRNVLRDHNAFVTDLKCGFQEVMFFPSAYTPEQCEARMKSNMEAEKRFNAWLFSMRSKIKSALQRNTKSTDQ